MLEDDSVVALPSKGGAARGRTAWGWRPPNRASGRVVQIGGCAEQSINTRYPLTPRQWADTGPNRSEDCNMKHLLAVIGIGVAASLLVALAPQASVQAREAQYVGARSCSLCHRHKKDGEQYKIWQHSKHSHAYEVLGTSEAKAAAKTVGVTTDPQKSEACLICHTTGYGQPKSKFEGRFHIKDGVQCEACHGAGSLYKSRRVMKKIRAETGPAWNRHSPTAEKMGLHKPDENTCKQCHTQQREFKGKTYKNPKYKPFNFKTYWEKIKHPIPS